MRRSSTELNRFKAAWHVRSGARGWLITLGPPGVRADVSGMDFAVLLPIRPEPGACLLPEEATTNAHFWLGPAWPYWAS